jgi:hypothetical protein
VFRVLGGFEARPPTSAQPRLGRRAAATAAASRLGSLRLGSPPNIGAWLRTLGFLLTAAFGVSCRRVPVASTGEVMLRAADEVLASMVFAVEDEREIHYESFRHTVGEAEATPRTFWLFLDHGRWLCGTQPKWSRCGDRWALEAGVSDGQSFWFRQTRLGTKEAPGDDPTSWTVCVAWRGSLRSIAEHGGVGCQVHVFYGASVPPGARLQVSEFSTFTIRRACPDRVVLHAGFRVQAGASDFPAGNGEIIVSLPSRAVM